MSRTPWLAWACLLFSGAGALAQESAWEKYLALLLGSAAPARALVLSVIMAGMAAGYLLGGSASLKAERPLRSYARLEALLGVWCLLFPALYRLGAWACLRSGGGPAPRFLLCLGLIAPPALLMGATLPLAAAAESRAGAALAGAYAANTLGAFAGALLAGLALIRLLGLDGTMAAAGLLSLAAALAASLDRSPAAGVPAADAAPAALWPVGAAALAGACALAQEAAWARVFTGLLGASTYAFTVVLAAVLLGLGGGGALARRLLREREPEEVLGWGLAASGLCTLAVLPLVPRVPYLFHEVAFAMQYWAPSYRAHLLMTLGLCGLFAAAPAFFSGMALPAAAAAGGWGRTLAVNAAGGALGAAAAGFLLLPRVGMQGVLAASAVLGAAAGAVVLGRRGAWPLLAAGLLCAGALRPWDPRLTTYEANRRLRAEPAPSYRAFREELSRSDLLFHAEGADSDAVVVRGQDGKALYVNGRAEASRRDLADQVLSAQLPLLLAPEGAGRTLVIGLGSGATAGSALRSSRGETEVVEISPEVVSAARLFAEENGGVLDDPRLRLRVEDAGRFLRLPGPSYRVILSEPSNTWVAGVAGLYTREYFEAAKRRLEPGGAMAQWFHLYEMDDRGFLTVLRTFRRVFPHVTVWNPEGMNLLLIGSQERLPFEPAVFLRRASAPEAARELERVGARAPEVLLCLQALSEEAVTRLAETPGPEQRDLRPVLEYEAPAAQFRGEWSRLLLAHDERRQDLRGSGLLLSRWLKAPPRAWTGKTGAQVLAYHARSPGLADLSALAGQVGRSIGR